MNIFDFVQLGQGFANLIPFIDSECKGKPDHYAAIFVYSMFMDMTK